MAQHKCPDTEGQSLASSETAPMWWDEDAAAVSAVVDMVMNSNDNDQQQRDSGEGRMLFPPEPEEIATGAPSGALAPKMVHAHPVESIVNC
jgi:hypothetical protein